MNTEKIDATIVNTFLDTFSRVFNNLFLMDLDRGSLSFWEDPFEENEVAIITGVMGENHEGTIAYSMQEKTARRLVDKIDMGGELSSYGEVLFDVLGEWMNIISGNVTRDMDKKGICLYVTPPSIVLGDHFSMQLVRQVPLFVEMQSTAGKIGVNLALKNVVKKDLIVNI